MPRSPHPRNAASLVVLRGTGARAEVLLGRRDPGDRFMPDIYVFPGGRVDRRDASAEVASELRTNVSSKLCLSGSVNLARALGVAAVRETYEETGLAFGRMEDGRLCPDLDSLDYIARAITPASSPIRYHARFFLAPAERGRGELRGNGELLDLAWVSLPDVEDLPVMDVTKLVLREAAHRAELRPDVGVARISYHGSRPRIRYE